MQPVSVPRWTTVRTGIGGYRSRRVGNGIQMNTAAKKTRYLLLSILAALGLSIGLVVAPVGADVTVPLENVVRGEPGSVSTVAETTVDPAIVGQSCVVSVVIANQESTNPETDLIITSGDATVEISGVEDEANGETKQSEPIIIGESLNVQVRLGPSGVASMGFDLSFECKPPETPPAPAVPDTPTYTG